MNAPRSQQLRRRAAKNGSGEKFEMAHYAGTGCLPGKPRQVSGLLKRFLAIEMPAASKHASCRSRPTVVPGHLAQMRNPHRCGVWRASPQLFCAAGDVPDTVISERSTSMLAVSCCTPCTVRSPTCRGNGGAVQLFAVTRLLVTEAIVRSDTESSSREAVSRRSFGRAAALTVAGGLLVPTLVSAHTQESTQQSAASSERDEVEAKLRSVIARWGERLSQAQRQRIRRVLQYHVRMLQAVRAFPVQNGDSPAPVLKLVGSRAAAQPRRARSSHGE